MKTGPIGTLPGFQTFNAFFADLKGDFEPTRLTDKENAAFLKALASIDGASKMDFLEWREDLELTARIRETRRYADGRTFVRVEFRRLEETDYSCSSAGQPCGFAWTGPYQLMAAFDSAGALDSYTVLPGRDVLQEGLEFAVSSKEPGPLHYDKTNDVAFVRDRLTSGSGWREVIIYDKATHGHLANLPFLFKGGTSLLLALREPGRVSVDLDIICRVPKEKFEGKLREWVKYPPFTRWENDVRESDSEPPTRRHYKVFYRGKFGSVTMPHYVLLDVVEEECGIAPRNTHRVGIDCPFLVLEGSTSKVQIPKTDALLGDKLTAFAPNTTGVPFVSPRRMADSAHQVFKQLFDVAQLFDRLSDFTVFQTTFMDVVGREAEYKSTKGVPESVLRDIIKTAFDITTFDIRRKKLDPGYERLIRSGIDKMNGDLINGSRFGFPEAKTAAAKASYLAALLLERQNSYVRYSSKSADVAKLVANRMAGPLQVLDKLKGEILTAD